MTADGIEDVLMAIENSATDGFRQRFCANFYRKYPLWKGAPMAEALKELLDDDAHRDVLSSIKIPFHVEDKRVIAVAAYLLIYGENRVNPSPADVLAVARAIESAITTRRSVLET